MKNLDQVWYMWVLLTLSQPVVIWCYFQNCSNNVKHFMKVPTFLSSSCKRGHCCRRIWRRESSRIIWKHCNIVILLDEFVLLFQITFMISVDILLSNKICDTHRHISLHRNTAIVHQDLSCSTTVDLSHRDYGKSCTAVRLADSCLRFCDNNINHTWVLLQHFQENQIRLDLIRFLN